MPCWINAVSPPVIGSAPIKPLKCRPGEVRPGRERDPPAARVGQAAGGVDHVRGALTSGLDHILLVAAVVALVAGVVFLIAIRGKDFAQQQLMG